MRLSTVLFVCLPHLFRSMRLAVYVVFNRQVIVVSVLLIF